MTSDINKAQQPTHAVDRSSPVQFSFDGRTYTGYAGDTIASALYRAGVRTFSRSFKYHRPRGLMCLSGSCPNCLVNVDGTPSVRACTTPVDAGMQVQGQNAWPSLEHDLMTITDKASGLLPVGFYYKTFIRPRAMWPIYETVLRNAAGLGTIDPDPDQPEERYYDKQYRHTDVTVVGGGPAGMSAALAAANQDVQVTLIDENLELGGHLRYQNFKDATRNTQHDLVEAVQSHDNIDILTSATAFGWYEDSLIGVVRGNRLVKLRTEQLVVATGRIEQPLVFQNNDLPGVFLGTGLQRLINLYGVWPGRRAVVVTSNDVGWQVARDLLDNNVDVAMIVDARTEIPESDVVTKVRAAGVAVLPSHTIQAAKGSNAVAGATIIRLDPTGNPIPGTEIELACDLISMSTGFVANNALLYQSGCELRYDADLGDVVLQDGVPGVRGAGHAKGTHGLQALLLEGQVAGLEAALSLDSSDDNAAEDRLADLRKELSRSKAHYRSQLVVRPLRSVPTDSKKKFVCFCEDVTEADLRDAIGEGFHDIETLKRYSTISMGPCQGKMCSMNSIRLCARGTGRSISETGTTTSRPPFTPVKLGVLAGRRLEPVRHTPLHHRHLDLGAHMMDAGQWKRPEHYGDPSTEVQAVHERVGIIDVSTLGKIDVYGPDAVEFLERVYTNRYENLAPGQIRYGLMCTEEGIIFDDGVVCCADENQYYLTTTTSGIEGVYQWLRWWLADWRLQVHVTDVTMSYAAVNVAGPRAREVLTRLTDLDLTTGAFPYMHFRDTTVAGVPARLLRIGFVGEVGYEIHFPAEYGEYMWDTLMDAGAQYGIKPFGIEAQRVLRLEKKHIIIGQDTDALSDPYGAGMGWAVDNEKGDFIGKPSLVHRAERDDGEQLVGFEMLDPSVLPSEGEQITDNGQLSGRITSARYSPTLSKSIGLAWVPADKAHAGSVLQVRTNGAVAYATVATRPFYDPAGERLRL